MEEQHTIRRLDEAACYEITVQGLVSEHWLSYFEEMQVSAVGEDGWAITTLTGIVTDQAMLHGLLQKLYTLGLVLIRVERKE
jgi:hypothetical protein